MAIDIDYSIQYGKWHNDSDEHYADQAAFYQRLLAPALAGLAPNSRILDVGCGTGLLVNALIVAGFKQARGIDLSAQQIAVAKKRKLPCEQVGHDDIHEMAATTPANFDAIFLTDVLEHVPIDAQVPLLRSVQKLLVPGGRLTISVPNASASFGMRQLCIDWTHVSAFTEHSLDFVLRNAGFEELSLLPYRYGAPPSFPYAHQAASYTTLLRFFFRGMRRLEAVAELGRQGLRIPLDLNLLAVAIKH